VFFYFNIWVNTRFFFILRASKFCLFLRASIIFISVFFACVFVVFSLVFFFLCVMICDWFWLVFWIVVVVFFHVKVSCMCVVFWPCFGAFFLLLIRHFFLLSSVYFTLSLRTLLCFTLLLFITGFSYSLLNPLHFLIKGPRPPLRFLVFLTNRAYFLIFYCCRSVIPSLFIFLLGFCFLLLFFLFLSLFFLLPFSLFFLFGVSTSPVSRRVRNGACADKGEGEGLRGHLHRYSSGLRHG